MTKTEYLNALADRLKRLPKEDFDMAMEYFEEYFQEAGAENEQQAMENLGTPQAAAEQIIQDIAQRNVGEPAKNIKQGLSKVWVGILAVFAVPIAFPAAIVAIALVFALIVTVGSVVLALVITGVAGVLVSVVTAAVSIVMMFTSFADGVANFGLSLLCLGVFLLLTYGGWRLCMLFERMIVALLGRIAKKGGRKNEK